MNLSRTRLLGLSRKYRALARLRRSALAPKEALRPLAQEFPGALRELECLPLDLLERRLAAVEAAERGEAPEQWIGWMLAYHQRMAVALEAKRLLRGARPSDLASIARVAQELSHSSDELVDLGFVARVSAPPAGRLNRLVFAMLEQELGSPRHELEEALFPRLRRA